MVLYNKVLHHDCNTFKVDEIRDISMTLYEIIACILRHLEVPS